MLGSDTVLAAVGPTEELLDILVPVAASLVPPVSSSLFHLVASRHLNFVMFITKKRFNIESVDIITHAKFGNHMQRSEILKPGGRPAQDRPASLGKGTIGLVDLMAFFAYQLLCQTFTIQLVDLSL